MLGTGTATHRADVPRHPGRPVTPHPPQHASSCLLPRCSPISPCSMLALRRLRQPMCWRRCALLSRGPATPLPCSRCCPSCRARPLRRTPPGRSAPVPVANLPVRAQPHAPEARSSRRPRRPMYRRGCALFTRSSVTPHPMLARPPELPRAPAARHTSGRSAPACSNLPVCAQPPCPRASQLPPPAGALPLLLSTPQAMLALLSVAARARCAAHPLVGQLPCL